MKRELLNSPTDTPAVETRGISPNNRQQIVVTGNTKVTKHPLQNFITAPAPEPIIARNHAMVMAGVKNTISNQKTHGMNNCGWDRPQPNPCSGPTASGPSFFLVNIFYNNDDSHWYLHVEINEPNCNSLTCKSTTFHFGQFAADTVGFVHHYAFTFVLDCNNLPAKHNFKLNNNLIRDTNPDSDMGGNSEWTFHYFYYFINCCGYQTQTYSVNNI